MTDEPTKRCTKCGAERPLSEFPLEKRYPGKRRSWCLPCYNEYGRQWRRQNLVRIRARDRRYWRKYKAYRAVYERRPDVRRKRTIRMAVYWAVQTGLIERPDACERCGARADEARIHAHHPDYNQPLTVVWLCTLCHGDEHHRLRAERATAPDQIGGTHSGPRQSP